MEAQKKAGVAGGAGGVRSGAGRGSEVLFAEALAGFLPEERMGRVHVLGSVDSTNTVLKGMGAAGAPGGTVVMAEHQSGGRGRRGRSFVSPAGAGVYLSYLFRPESGFEKAPFLACWAAVAAAEAIRSAFGVGVGIKWVNDLVLNRRKVGGILVEATAEGGRGVVDTFAIGIGVNVNEGPGDFPGGLSEIATSLAMESGGKAMDRARLAAELVKALDDLGAEWPGGTRHLERYRELCLTPGSEITAYPQMLESGNGRRGTALAVNDDFSLKVEFADGGIENLRSGEASVRGLCGYA